MGFHSPKIVNAGADPRRWIHTGKQWESSRRNPHDSEGTRPQAGYSLDIWMLRVPPFLIGWVAVVYPFFWKVRVAPVGTSTR